MIKQSAGGKQKFRVPLKELHVNVFLVDTRDIPMVAHLQGKLRMPELLMEEGHLLRWNLDGFAEENRPKGVVTDVGPDRMSLTFPFVEECDATLANGQVLAFEHIISLFLREEPTLSLLAKGMKGSLGSV